MLHIKVDLGDIFQRALRNFLWDYFCFIVKLYNTLSAEVDSDNISYYNKKCNKHVTNAPKGIGLA